VVSPHDHERGRADARDRHGVSQARPGREAADAAPHPETGGNAATHEGSESMTRRGQMAVFLAAALGLHFPN
jgi:hypothetical protein